MLFIWGPEKALANLRKHRVSFEVAQTVFEDPLHLSVLDRKLHEEERWVTIGRCADRTTLLVVHLYRSEAEGEETIRIISARRATRKEARQYEEGI